MSRGKTSEEIHTKHLIILEKLKALKDQRDKLDQDYLVVFKENIANCLVCPHTNVEHNPPTELMGSPSIQCLDCGSHGWNLEQMKEAIAARAKEYGLT